MRGVLGLRGKSAIALFATCLLVLLVAAVIAWQLTASMRVHLGTAYTRNFTLLYRERILAPVARELALAVRFAGSAPIHDWLREEGNAERRAYALREAEGYRRDFADHSYFLASAASGRYYFSDDAAPGNGEPRYVLSRDEKNDSWFYATLQSPTPYALNVDPSAKIGQTKVWFNVLVRDAETVLGIAGTGLDLSTFLNQFIHTGEPGVTPMIVDVNGAIQAHPDSTRIAFNAGVQGAAREKTLFGILGGAGDEEAARLALDAARDQPGSAQVFPAAVHGKPQLVAVSYIPELKWHVLTAVDLDVVNIFDRSLLQPLAIAAILLLLLLTAGFAFAMNRLVLRPVLNLKQSALEIARGDYTVRAQAERRDEIGELAHAFNSMASTVQAHTTSLEQTVRERTRELVQANAEMASAHKKISDSISYASLIQRAILPDNQIRQAFGDRHFVLWRPRDVVGGDFYVYREVEGGCLIGVVDCAGHGVPGAIMTMLARAAIDQAIAETPAADPALILARTDQAVRSMLDGDTRQRDIATLMDAGLAHVDLRARRITFAGARVALYWSDGDEVASLAGERRSLGQRRVAQFKNSTVALEARRTFLMTTDGFLDQAGGPKGYGFGNTRFIDMLRRHSGLPLAEQAQAFSATLDAWRGTHAQRDDITVVCFRFD